MSTIELTDGDGVVRFRGTSSGGSQPGAVRWIGPCKVNAFGGQTIQNGGGDVDGGTFTLSHDGSTTIPIAWDASEAALLAVLETVFGSGNVRIDQWIDANSDAYIIFNELAASELMTIDTAALTGPSAPYVGYAVAGMGTWTGFPLVAPAVGDIIEDFMHSVRTGFTGSSGVLIYTDSPSADPEGSAPVWAMPTSAQGLDGLQITQSESDYTNFSGSAGADPTSRATALVALIAAWSQSAVNGDDPPNTYANLPALAVNAVPLYPYIRDVDTAPTEGEVWIWTKVSTPAEMS